MIRRLDMAFPFPELWLVALASMLIGVGFSGLYFSRKTHHAPDTGLMTALERSGLGYVRIDSAGCILSHNAALENLTGLSNDEFTKLRISSLFVDHEHTGSGRFITSIVFTPPYDRTHSYDLTAVKKDGARIPVEVWFAGEVSGTKAQTQWLIRDVRETKEVERLRLSEERYKSSRTFANIGTWDWTVGSDALHWSEEVAPMFGLPSDTVPAYSLFCEAVHPEDRARVKENEDICIAQNLKHDVEYRVVWPDGTVRWLRETGNLLRDEHGNLMRMIGVVRDITDQKEIEHRYRHMAYHDPLTGLPNRGLFEQRLDLAVQRATRHQVSTAVMFLDLGKFKSINDTYGHIVGDEVLIEAGSRLKSAVRGTDTVARIGGDEFVLILEDLKNVNEADKLAQKIIAAFQEPMDILSHSLTIDLSIGISICPDNAATTAELIHLADTAMYAAKAAGRNKVRTA